MADGQAWESEHGWMKDAVFQKDRSDALAFRNVFAILHNIDMWELENAGIIRKGDNDKWTRFNQNLTTFILKLDDAKLDALCDLVQSRQPERYRRPATTQVEAG